MNPSLKSTINKLLLEADWNCSNYCSKIAKIIYHANRGDLVKAIEGDLERLHGRYMDKMDEVVAELKKYKSEEIMFVLDEFITESSFLDSEFSRKNYITLRDNKRLDLIKEFCSDFRGLIIRLTTIPFTRGARTIVRTISKKDQTEYFVMPSGDESGIPVDTSIGYFEYFDDAVAYCLSPIYYSAISKLIKN